MSIVSMQQPRGKTLSGSVLTLERLNWQAGPCDVCCLTTAQMMMMMMMMNRNITAFMVSATAQCAFHSGLVVVVTDADTDADADQRRLDDDDDDETKR